MASGIRGKTIDAAIATAPYMLPNQVWLFILKERDHQVLEGRWAYVGDKPLFNFVYIHCPRAIDTARVFNKGV